jgi:hypothetical protein
MLCGISKSFMRLSKVPTLLPTDGKTTNGFWQNDCDESVKNFEAKA